MRSVLLFIFLSFTITYTSGQKKILLNNPQKINPRKYEGIKGSAYLWDKNKEVTIYSFESDKIEHITGNYNLVDKVFEAYQDNKYIILPFQHYPILEYSEDGKKKKLFANIHPKLNNSYSLQHYQSENFRVFENKRKKKKTLTFHAPGKDKKIHKFITYSDYFILYQGSLISIPLQIKKIIKKFGHKKEIKKFIKENKLKIKKIADMIILLEYIDKQGWMDIN